MIDGGTEGGMEWCQSSNLREGGREGYSTDRTRRLGGSEGRRRDRETKWWDDADEVGGRQTRAGSYKEGLGQEARRVGGIDGGTDGETKWCDDAEEAGGRPQRALAAVDPTLPQHRP